LNSPFQNHQIWKFYFEELEMNIAPAKGKALIKTDIAIAIPENTYARIAPRSGLAWKHFIDVGAGVVDYDYRGPVGVVLYNHGDADFTIERGDRIAQLILERICMADVKEVEELPDTDRGSGGFGSTGGVSNKETPKDDEDKDKENKKKYKKN
jgi:dUTP pyrophosphatase